MSALRAVAAALLVGWIALAATPTRIEAAQPATLATPWTELHGSRVRLIAGPGKTEGRYLAALEITLAEGWKTYWRMPGDSGVPPSFDWDKSENLATARALYPAPIRMPEAGGTAIGYKGSVVLPIEITPKDPAKPVALNLALEFGLCRDICIPALAAFDLTIPPGASGAPPGEIAAALDRVPRSADQRRKGDPELKSASLKPDGQAAKLVIEAVFPDGAQDADAFIEAPEGFYVPVPKRAGEASNGGTLRFESELGRELAQDLKGKPLTITLVSRTGASEVRWTVP